METEYKRSSIDTSYTHKSEIPTLKETLQTIWHTPNLPLIAATNCLEWIDMFLFIHCASLFAAVFAPQDLQDKMAMIFTAILWIVPSLSAIILGVISDRFGRRRPLMITAYGVFLLTGLLAMTPTYDQAGMLAFGIFMGIRILMSFVISGENILAGIYAYESSKRYEDTILSISLVDLGEICAGIFILSVSTFLLSMGETFSTEYITRILMICLVCCFGFLIKNRSKLEESNAFLAERDMTQNKEFYGNTYIKLKNIIKNDPNTIKSFFCYFGTKIAYPIAFVVVYIYMPDILKNVFNYSQIDVFQYNLMLLLSEGAMNLIIPIIAFQLENNEILNRKKFSIIFLLFSFSVTIFMTQFLNSQHINIAIMFVSQIIMLYTCTSITAGQFFSQFPVLGRARLSTIGWGVCKIFSTFSSLYLLETLHIAGGYDYLYVFAIALIIHISSIYLSKEPTRSQKSFGFDGRWMLEKKQLQKQGYKI